MRASQAAPFDLDPKQLVCVALALNHPVVGLDPLPPGPASAAIAVHESGIAALVIRSQRSGDVAWIDTTGGDAERAFERALHRAEGLGFLFEQVSYEPRVGLLASVWPDWLREIFAEAEEAPAPPSAALPARDEPVSGWLSKFRWALPESV